MSIGRHVLVTAVIAGSFAILDAQVPATSGRVPSPPGGPGQTSPIAVLYDQYTNASAANVVSQDFEAAFNGFDSQAADDFAIPAATFWRVVEVDVDGEYFNGTGPAASLNVTFYSNAGGGLPGVVQCARTSQPVAGANGDFTIVLTSPCVLGPGTHWLSVQARQDFDPAGEWGWHNRTVTSNSGAAWINPQDGFGSGCTSWGRKTTCLPTQDGPDQVFRLLGGSKSMVTGDFDGNGATDYTVLRFPSGPITWYMLGGGFSAVQWGNTSTADFAYEGDFDGDSRADPVVCTGSHLCYVRRSSNGSLLALQWGMASDNALVPGDYDNDGRTDFAVFRPSNGTWYVNRSTDGSLLAQAFGLSTDRVAPGDYDGDGRADFAVFRPSTGTFYLLQSTAGFTGIPWGSVGDVQVTGDFDGDGKADPTVARNVGGNIVIYVRQSSSGALLGVQWGLAATDIITPGDYDGDKKTDIAVWRNGVFYVRRSSNGALIVQPWGQTGDYALMSYTVH